MLSEEFDRPAAPYRRRRVVVFGIVFFLSLAVSVGILFTRPAIYRAEARLEITPGTIPQQSDTPLAAGDAPDRPFLTEIQNLTSRALLSNAAATLAKASALPSDLGPDTVGALQPMLSADQVDGTRIVALRAEGRHPAFLPLLVNQVVATYQERLEAGYKALAQNADAGLADELRVLDDKVAAKRAEIDGFRARYDIVSLERDENEALTQQKSTQTALNDANNRAAEAEGKLQALRGSGPAGLATVRAKDDPTVANLEQRASQIREELKDLGRKYTAQYMDLDPDVRAQRARLADLEQQIETARSAGQRSRIAETEQDLSTARETAAKLKKQLDDGKEAARVFSERFGEYKSLQDDLAGLEDLHRAALERVAKLEARERESAPQMRIVESAIVPTEAWRPRYLLDAGLSLAGSLALGFFAVWFAEFFETKPKPGPGVMIRQVLGGVALPHALTAAEGPVMISADGRPAIAGPSTQRLVGAKEIASLLDAATEDGRIAVGALLTGLAPAELPALRWEDVDALSRTVAVHGDSARTLTLPPRFHDWLTARRMSLAVPEGPVLRRSDRPMTEDEIAHLVTFAAFDAGLDRPDEMTPKVLRSAYVAFLIGQGMRLGDLARIVGRISPEELRGLVGDGGQRLPFERVDAAFPALKTSEEG